MNISIDDVKWSKQSTYSIIDGEVVENDDTMCVIGTINGIEIGHYLNGRDNNTINCCVIIKENDGDGYLVINRTYTINDNNQDDQFYRKRIVRAYNNYSKIKSIFD